MNAQEKFGNDHYQFIDFRSFDELSRQPKQLEQLINCYRDIFAEPEIWNETYSVAQVKQKLQQELTGKACLRICIYHSEQDSERTVVGFCWAQVLDSLAVMKAIEAVPYIQENHIAVAKEIETKVGVRPLIYLQDLGIAKAFRHTIPLEKLIAPVLEDVAMRGQLREVFFWSVSQTCVGWLAEKFGVPKVFAFRDAVFFKGKLPSLEVMVG